MRPAFSVVFLTTLIGAAQGLFLAVFLDGEVGPRIAQRESPRLFLVAGAAASVVLAALGLLASFFHLGRPERAWRSAAMWRTSWLSREVIALPAFMASVAAYGAAHHFGGPMTLALGAVATLACLALFYCTAMIYACIKFLPEWASPYTIPNFFLMGCASGATLALVLAAVYAPALTGALAMQSVGFTLIAFVVRLASLARNDRIVPRSTLQSAIGVNAPKVRQISQGFTGESFNTLEFFHGKAPGTLAAVRIAFLALAFGVPIALVAIAYRSPSIPLFAAAFLCQYAGLVLERWYFLAQANHAQNLYYQNRA